MHISKHSRARAVQCNQATLDALDEAVTVLQKGLEAYLANASTDRSHAEKSEAMQMQQECCKFCRSVSHLEEECAKVDEYILAGKCKHDTFRRLTLPSGAQVP